MGGDPLLCYDMDHLANLTTRGVREEGSWGSCRPPWRRTVNGVGLSIRKKEENKKGKKEKEIKWREKTSVTRLEREED